MHEFRQISVFVDESGSFAPDGVDVCSPYYLLCMVFHDREADMAAEEGRLAHTLVDVGLGRDHAVHAGPIIRREELYAQMPRAQRIGIFRRMMIFMSKIDFRYRCFTVFKPYNTRQDAIHDSLLQDILDFLVRNRASFNGCDEIRIYYDNGQSQVTALLREAFSLFSSKVKFVPDVQPARYRLFQVADMICTLELVSAKLADTGQISHSEERFFGGVKNLKKVYLKPLLRKRWA